MLTFSDVHQALKDTDASVDELGFHSANAIVEQIVQQLRHEMPNDVPPLHQRNDAIIVQPLPNEKNDNHLPSQPTQQGVANTTQSEQNMATLMSTMIANMEAMRLRIEDNDATNNMYGRGRGRGGCRGRGRGRRYGRRNARGRGRLTQGRRRGGQHCFTHGNCAHNSAECETQGPGHQTEATFTNMMGSSTENCD